VKNIAKKSGLTLSAAAVVVALVCVLGCPTSLPTPTPTGACCAADDTCSIMTQTDCVSAGGTYQGDDTTCTPNPCAAAVTGACCAADGSCSVTTQTNCENAGGTYQGDDTACTPDPCGTEITGACCATDGTCSVTTQTDCENAGGTYQGDDTSCTPNPCVSAPDGATLYANNCAVCHGSTGANGAAPDITGKTAEEISAEIAMGGVHAGVASLNEAEIEAIAAFLGG